MNAANMNLDNVNFPDNVTPMGIGSNYTFEAIMNLIGNTAQLQNSMANQMVELQGKMSVVETETGKVVKSINVLNDQMSKFNDEINDLKLNEEVTTEQATMMLNCTKRRVGEILGDDPIERSKYFRGFSIRLWSDLRKKGKIATQYCKTKKRDYQGAIDAIEAWLPEGGIAHLKQKLDESAAARKKTKDEGYQ